MQTLLGPRSARIVAARKLQRRRGRTQTGLLLVEGPQALGEAVSAGVLVEIFATVAGAAAWSALAQSAAKAGAAVHLIDTAVLASLTTTENPQGVVGVARWVQPSLAEVLTGAPRLVLLAHEVSDPGNAGALIRVADAVAADFVALSENSVDATNAKCVRASTGSVFHLPIVAAGETLGAVAALRAAGLQVLAADVGADSVDLFDIAAGGALSRPTAWLMGNEAHGLPGQLRAVADHVVRIPIPGGAESLNLATAAAVCLYASLRELGCG